MKVLSVVSAPTGNRRLNELIGLVAFTAGLLLLLALASYSPLDPSLNTAAAPPEVKAPQNWIGVTGAHVSDLLLQLEGVSAFLLPAFLILLSANWFWSR